jgi:hypothetical protein
VNKIYYTGMFASIFVVESTKLFVKMVREVWRIESGK